VNTYGANKKGFNIKKGLIMNKEQILSNIKSLAKSQGLYGRMYEFLTSGTDEAENALTTL
jgi:hypothetical protein